MRLLNLITSLTRFARATWLLRILTLVVMLGTSGCAGFQHAVDSLNVWQSNRCNCETGNCVCGNHNCEAQDVVLGSPQGYLSEGANFSGEQIAGPPGKTALMRALELQEEVEQLRQEKQELYQQLELSKQQQEAQQAAISVAQRELSRAMEDYAVMRRRLEAWYSELDHLDEQYRAGTQQRDSVMDEFERELETILAQCRPAEVPTAAEDVVAEPGMTKEVLTEAPDAAPALEAVPEGLPEPPAEVESDPTSSDEELLEPVDPGNATTPSVSLVAPQNQSSRTRANGISR
jgi:hypothetical protein